MSAHQYESLMAWAGLEAATPKLPIRGAKLDPARHGVRLFVATWERTAKAVTSMRQAHMENVQECREGLAFDHALLFHQQHY